MAGNRSVFGLLGPFSTSKRSYAASWQQQLANGGMWPAISAPNLVLGLPTLPSAPDVDLLRGINTTLKQISS